MQSSYSIDIKEAAVGYDSGFILSGITLSISGGDFVGIVGPNGSGKTTLLRMIARILHPTQGEVRIAGRDIRQISSREFAQALAVVPQDTVPAFDFTALEIVLMGRSPHLGRFQIESTSDMDIAKAAMRQTGTLDIAGRPFAALSGGERQRVVIARALAQEPKIILLDEPTSHLDINYQFEILELMRRLNRERGITIITVLHDLNLAAQYCDRLVMVGSGRIQSDGPPLEVLTAENVRNVYGAEVWVRRHPTTGRPYVISGVGQRINEGVSESFERRPKVHVICGGGTGAPIFAKLLRRGYEVTAGVINEGDTDQEAAEVLGIAYIATPPFTPVSEESIAANEKMIHDSDMVVVSDVPIGSGNLSNLKSASSAVKSGKQVVILRPDSIVQRDFTDGLAAELVQSMQPKASNVNSLDELASAVEDCFRRQ